MIIQKHNESYTLLISESEAEKQAGVQDETSNRSNNFEVTSITYKSPEVLTGWDDI